MKKCLRQKCQKEFEPNKPKQVFCSAKCRVYFSREQKSKTIPSVSLPLDVDVSVKPPTAKGNQKIQKMIAEMKENEIPRLKGESSIEYRLRMIELSENKGN